MCHLATVRVSAVLLTLALGASVWAQPAPDWRRIGPTSMELMLASPAGGPVDRVWFSGSTLYAQTRAGKVFQTADFETWSPAPDAAVPAEPANAAVPRKPEAGARIVAANPDPSTLYALARNVYRSSDGGRSWEPLTAYRSQSIIGGGQRSIAVNGDQIVVANDFGVWRSMDGGLTWDGLNGLLPNMPVRRILSTPAGGAGTRIGVENLPVLELPPGGNEWIPSANSTTDQDKLAAYSNTLGTQIVSFGAAGQAVYAGSKDGQIWYSTDGGSTFNSVRPAGVGGPIERIWVDAAHPQAALAAVGGPAGTAHVLHTFNSGLFWDRIDAMLPDAPAHSVTADASAGAIYVATAKGVFWTTADLLSATGELRWTSASAGLPDAPAYDVKLDPSGVQLYVALDGFGVYAAPAPHRQRSLRVINTADFSTRPAAPGSLLSVVGRRVNAARGENLSYPVLGLPTDGESQIQVPFGAVGPNVALTLDTTAGAVTVPIQVQPVSPAIFVMRDGSPTLFDADSGLPLDGRNPARSNGRVQIFATGLGKVRPEAVAGVATPLQGPAPVVVGQVRAYLNGQPLQVTRARLEPGYTGVYSVDVQLPAIANFGSSQLYISVDGQESNRVQIIIEP